MIFADSRCLDHDPTPHPESPERLRALLSAVDDRGLPTESAPEVSRSALARVHDPSYLDELQAFCESGGGYWDTDTVAVPETFDAAQTSVALATAAVSATAADGGPSFSLGRPPGHHATRDDAMGFCFLNGAAVAVESALADTDRGPPVDRVAVVDWDVHHGNGTASQFSDRGDVLYASIHAEGLFPGTGAPEQTGIGPGEGTTLNLPVPPDAGDEAVLAVYERVVDPVVRAFDPDLVIVSAGFDAHRRDPLSRTQVTTEGFGSLAALLGQTTRAVDARGPTVVLEGGYDRDALVAGFLAVHDALVDPPSSPTSPESVPDTVAGLVAEQCRRFDC